MNKYPNTIKESLEKYEELNEQIQQVLIDKFNQSKQFFINDKFDAKILDNKKNHYLVVRDIERQTFSIYEKKVYSLNKTPFESCKGSLSENGSFYGANLVYVFSTNKKLKEIDVNGSTEEESESLTAKVSATLSNGKAVNTEDLAKFLKLFRRGHNKPDYFVSSSPYNIKQFVSFLGIEKPDDFWVQLSTPLNKVVDKMVDEFSISLQYLFSVAESFKNGSKYTFNDLDNNFWKNGKGIVFDNQNLGFFCLMKGDKNFTVYCYDKEGNSIKRHGKLNQLLKDLKDNGENLINQVALKVEDGKTTFVDNSLVYCFVLDLIATKDSLIEDGYGEPEYPVDIYSYEYQLSFHQKECKFTEAEFIQQAILILGGGFEYDAKNGRFFSKDIFYNPDIVDYRLESEKPLKDISGKASYLKDFNKVTLDSSWAAGIERFLKILKENRPTPTWCENPTPEKLDSMLNGIIKALEDKGFETSPKRLKP